jgi:hypothetical protein
MDAEFVTAYLTTPNAELAARYGVSVVTVLKWAQRAGVRKSPERLAAAQRERTLGRTHSPETRSKIAAAAKGRTVTAEAKAKSLQTKQKRGTLLKGDKHPNWKGGRPWKRFADPRYLAWRTSVLARDSYVCQKCGRRCKKYERGLAAHHVKAYASHPDLRYEVSNGVTLCRNCHLGLHGRAPKPATPVPCACGCGTMIQPDDAYGRPRRYVNYHGKRGSKMSADGRAKLSRERKGRPLTPEHRAKIAQGLRQSSRRIGRPPR